MTGVGDRPRVVPGDRWDEHEINDVIGEQVAQALDQVPWRFQPKTYRTEPGLAVSEVTAWVDELVTQAIEECQRGYPTVRHGRSLVLLGPTGRGKTHAAYGAMLELAGSGVRCRWLAVDAEDMFSQLMPRPGIDSETVFESFTGAGVLVVDEIGAHKPTEWKEVQLTRLVNHRYKHGRPSLYVTNLLPKQFDELVGERVASRLAECATEVVVSGPDRRRQGGAR